MNDDLKALRVELDKADAEIEKNFVKRMEISAKIAEYKIANNLPTYDPEREKIVLEKHANNVPKEFSEYVKDLWTNLMRISKEYQNLKRGTK